MKKRPLNEETIVIEPGNGWHLLDWRELVDYADLLFFMTRRSIRARYAQSALGIGWALVQPVVQMIVYTVIFGVLLNVDSDEVPYAVFNFCALVPWVYFTSCLMDTSGSMTANVDMLSKIYFPRIIIPLSAVLAKSLDFFIAFGLLLVLMLSFGIVPNWQIIYVPLLLVLLVATGLGIGLILSALAVQFRDVGYAMGLLMQLIVYAVPVVYSIDAIPEKYHLLYALNPMVGVIESFRAVLLSTRAMPWDLLAVGAPVAVASLVAGLLIFNNRQAVFADVA